MRHADIYMEGIYKYIMGDIHLWASHFTSILFNHAGREVNHMSDILAKQGSLNYSLILYEFPPQCINSALSKDYVNLW